MPREKRRRHPAGDPGHGKPNNPVTETIDMATAKKAAPAKKAAAKKVPAKKAPAQKATDKPEAPTSAAATPPAKAGRAKAAAPAKKRTPSAAFMKALTPSAALAAIVGDQPLPRTEVIKKLWVYIRQHGLQDSVQRTMINADAKLEQVFKQAKVSMFEMAKLLKDHLK